MQDLNIEEPHTGQRTKSEAVRGRCKLQQRQIKKQLAILRTSKKEDRKTKRQPLFLKRRGQPQEAHRMCKSE